MHNVYESLSDDVKAKVARLKKTSRHSAGSCNDLELVLAEFADYYGWDGVWAAMSGQVELETFFGLLEAGRRLHNIRRAEHLRDMFMAVAGSRSKKGVTQVNSELRKLAG